jgi:hypothetical protein
MFERFKFKGPVVLFMHVPKAAGTTIIREFLEPQFKKKHRFEINGNCIEKSRSDLVSFLQFNKNKYPRLVYGHLEYGWHEYFNVSTEYITVFRDPMERILSHYSYVLRSDTHYLRSTFMKGEMSLEDVLKNGVSTEYNNGQTRQLAGDRLVQAPYEHDRVPFGKCPGDMLDRAIKNLSEKFSVIGSTDNMNAFIDQCSLRYNWKKFDVGVLNRSGSRIMKKDLPESTIQTIREYNSLDLKLYEHVKQIVSKS